MVSLWNAVWSAQCSLSSCIGIRREHNCELLALLRDPAGLRVAGGGCSSPTLCAPLHRLPCFAVPVPARDRQQGSARDSGGAAAKILPFPFLLEAYPLSSL